MAAESRFDEFVRLWNDPFASRSYIRERLGCSYADMDRMQEKLGLPDKPPPPRLSWEPTEAEIEAATIEIQADWSRKKRKLHQTAASRQDAGMKQFSFCRRTMSFS